MFLATGSSGISGVASSGDFEYETSQEGGTENTMAEGIASGSGGYAGPNISPTRPLEDQYAPQALIAPINTVAAPPIPQAPNAYTDTGLPTMISTTQTTAGKPNGDCGCGGDCADCKKIPWYVLVFLVLGVALLLRGE